MLSQAHVRVGRHFEGAHLDQAKPATGAIGGVKFVEAELSAMSVAGGIYEEIAEEPINQPGWCVPEQTRLLLQLFESHFEFVNRIVARFINARRLGGWADEK